MTKKRREEPEDQDKEFEREVEDISRQITLIRLNKRFLGWMMIFSFLSFVLFCLTALFGVKEPIISGWQWVIIIGIIAAAVIIYYAFVFGRIARIKAKISQSEKQIDIEAGKKV